MVCEKIYFLQYVLKVLDKALIPPGIGLRGAPGRVLQFSQKNAVPHCGAFVAEYLKGNGLSTTERPDFLNLQGKSGPREQALRRIVFADR